MKKTPSPLFRNGFSRMILDDQIAHARRLHEDRRKRLAAVKTRKQAEAYRDEVSEKIARCFGDFPARSPLNARVTGKREFPKFRIENLVFESRPGFLVTANLYVPNGLRAPAPAVLGNCGHDRAGKAGMENQAYSQELAQCGFVVLTYDPIAQGERDQYLTLPATHALRKTPAMAHTMIGQQLQLTGEFLGTWMVWDGMRALDYLLSRPEVDPARVATTGNSGGGCLSTYLWALEPRIGMTAPSCWVNSFLSVIENEVGGDAEQIPPGALAHGLEQADFFLARAPGPALILAQKHDFFDRRGVTETSEEIARIYRLVHADKKFAFFIGENTHGYFPDARSKMREFFCREFGMRAPRRLPLEILPKENLFALPNGEVRLEGSRTAVELNLGIAAGLKAQRAKLTAKSFPQALLDVLGIERDAQSPVKYRNLRGDWLSPGVLFGRYAVSTEKGLETILRKAMALPPYGGLIQALSVEKEPTLYVPHWSCHADLLAFPPAQELLERLPLFTVDVRGVGESLCRDKADAEVHYWMDYFSHGFGGLLGISLVGRRVFDLLRTCDLLVQEGAKKIHLVGRGQGALLSAFAAALHPAIKSAELHDSPTSFEDWIAADDLSWPASLVPKNALKTFDLPDFRQAFRSKISVKSYWSPTDCAPPPSH